MFCYAILFICFSSIKKVTSYYDGRVTFSLRMTGSSQIQTNNMDFKKSVSKFAAAAIPIAAVISTSRRAFAADQGVSESSISIKSANLPLGKVGYTDLGGLPMCKILNGMWQVDSAHGYEPLKENAVSEMSHCAGKTIIMLFLRFVQSIIKN